MSAVLWEPVELDVPARATRPTLVLVQGGAAGSEGGALRLTRRGRLVLVLLAAAVAALAIAWSGMLGAGAAEPYRTITVQPGQTLSEIAVAELPDLSIDEGVAALRIANRLPTGQVDAGRVLSIPRP